MYVSTQDVKISRWIGCPLRWIVLIIQDATRVLGPHNMLDGMRSLVSDVHWRS